MSYAGMGQVASAASEVKVGELAKTDPIMSRASSIASQLMLKVATEPRPARKNLVRIYLNRLHSGMGDAAVREIERLQAKGGDPDQAVFDGIRLAVANQLHAFAEKILASQPSATSGLGSTATDIRSVGCFISGMSATAGGWTTLGGSSMAGASSTISAAAQAGADIQGCGIPAMQAQAEITRQQAAQAAQLAQMQQQTYGQQTSRYVMMAGAGIAGILVLAVAAKIALK